MEHVGMFCHYAHAVIDIRQVEGEGDRRNASRNRSNRAGTSFLFSFGQLAFLKSPQFEFATFYLLLTLVLGRSVR
jgi:hypothetical protein